MKITTFEEHLDKLYGITGTKNRNTFEINSKAFIKTIMKPFKQKTTPYYIPVFIETNSYSAEKLVGGILFFCGEEIVFRYAENKILASVQLGNIGSDTLIRQSFDNLAKKIQTNKELFNPDYLDYLRRYSNGVVQFGKPHPILLSLENFEAFAVKFLGEKIDEQPQDYDEIYLKPLREKAKKSWLGNIDPDKWLKEIRGRE